MKASLILKEDGNVLANLIEHSGKTLASLAVEVNAPQRVLQSFMDGRNSTIGRDLAINLSKAICPEAPPSLGAFCTEES